MSIETPELFRRVSAWLSKFSEWPWHKRYAPPPMESRVICTLVADDGSTSTLWPPPKCLMNPPPHGIILNDIQYKCRWHVERWPKQGANHAT